MYAVFFREYDANSSGPEALYGFNVSSCFPTMASCGMFDDRVSLGGGDGGQICLVV